MLGLEMAKRFSEIADAAGFMWMVAGINDKDVALVFYDTLPSTGSWLAPQLSFLPIIKRRSVRMYETVMNSLQHISGAFCIGNFLNSMECIEWALEELDSDAYDIEDIKERNETWKSVQSHTEGKAAKSLKEVTHGTPTLSPEECICRLYKLPNDLQDLRSSLIYLLCLSDRGKDLTDFDLNCAGLNRLDEMDNIYLTLDLQYAWIYDSDDPVTAKAEEYLDSLSNEGQQEPCAWLIIGDGFLFPKDSKSLIEELKNLRKDDFTTQFFKGMRELCEAIVDLKKRNKRNK
ncbi:MAG: hypothetical protein Q8R83_06140 [Legionellaceae bacterium]|nr:hypothetical protein [Legionellaceae bacterium]